MREIKFRAKRKDNGEWVVGFYFGITIFKDYPTNTIVDREAHFIIPFGIDMSKNKALGEIQVEVIPETVGQSTGLYDKNGKEIYEGDVVENIFRNKKQKLLCFWNSRDLCFYFTDHEKHDDFTYVLTNAKVIGNIHDNKELLV